MTTCARYVIIGMALATLYTLAADAAQPPEDQVRAAAEEAQKQPPQQWPECKWLTERICVSLDEWKRMQGEK